MGYSDTEFAPDDEITREQIAVIMHRTAKYLGQDVTVSDMDAHTGFTDASSISTFAVEGLRWAVDTGLMVGSDGKLNPLGYASRAESVTVLSRFFQEQP